VRIKTVTNNLMNYLDLFPVPCSLTTNNCTGEAFGELFLAMTDNLSSKCFAPTDNCTGEGFGELFLAMTDNLSCKCFAPTDN
jgi:hypothetical protein